MRLDGTGGFEHAFLNDDPFLSSCSVITPDSQGKAWWSADFENEETVE